MKYKGFEILVTCQRLETWSVDNNGLINDFEDEHELTAVDYFCEITEDVDGYTSFDELRADSIKELKKLIKAHIKNNEQN